MEEFTQSGNFNETWLKNIYENIKNIENYERLLRDGCKDVLDFVNMPVRIRPVAIGNTQFKTLSLIITEFKLLLADLTPILEDDTAKAFDKAIVQIDKASRLRSLFVSDYYDQSNNLIEVRPLPFLWETIDILHKTKVDLFKTIKHILYINQKNPYEE